MQIKPFILKVSERRNQQRLGLLSISCMVSGVLLFWYVVNSDYSRMQTRIDDFLIIVSFTLGIAAFGCGLFGIKSIWAKISVVITGLIGLYTVGVIMMFGGMGH